MFSEKLKELREAKGYTQIQAAAIVGVSGPSYAAYESGKSKPSIDALAKLAEHYKVSLDWLCGMPSDNTLQSYGDIAASLHRLLKTGLFRICAQELPVQSGREEFFSLWTNNVEFYGDDEGDFFIFPNIFDSFLCDYQKLRSLVFKGTLSEEILDSWLDSWMSKYGKTPIVTNGDTNAETQA